jgi:hypothetical protein
MLTLTEPITTLALTAVTLRDPQFFRDSVQVQADVLDSAGAVYDTRPITLRNGVCTGLRRHPRPPSAADLVQLTDVDVPDGFDVAHKLLRADPRAEKVEAKDAAEERDELAAAQYSALLEWLVSAGLLPAGTVI